MLSYSERYLANDLNRVDLPEHLGPNKIIDFEATLFEEKFKNISVRFETID